MPLLIRCGIRFDGNASLGIRIGIRGLGKQPHFLFCLYGRPPGSYLW